MWFWVFLMIPFCKCMFCRHNFSTLVFLGFFLTSLSLVEIPEIHIFCFFFFRCVGVRHGLYGCRGFDGRGIPRFDFLWPISQTLCVSYFYFFTEKSLAFSECTLLVLVNFCLALSKFLTWSFAFKNSWYFGKYYLWKSNICLIFPHFRFKPFVFA